MEEEEPDDQQWGLIAPLLPPAKSRGRPRADDRCTLDGILWMLRSGSRRKDLPPNIAVGPPATGGSRNGKNRVLGNEFG
ncbi:MAG: transposase [Dehalococcoidia bacterium]